MTTRLVVGLGNPGERYARTRHNVGWRVLDELARRRGLAFGPEAGAWRAAADARTGLVLLAPLTYMNRSGAALADWSARRGVPVTGAPPAPPSPAPDAGAEAAAEAAAAGSAAGPPHGPGAVRPLVVCDDLALPLGTLRLRARGSAGGQNGLASVIAHLGGEVFPRLRLGIAPAGEPVPPEAWADYVLEHFAAAEEDLVARVVARAADAVDCWLERGTEAAASRYNGRVPEAPPAG